jgi:hypothetical protein
MKVAKCDMVVKHEVCNNGYFCGCDECNEVGHKTIDRLYEKGVNDRKAGQVHNSTQSTNKKKTEEALKPVCFALCQRISDLYYAIHKFPSSGVIDLLVKLSMLLLN